MQEPLSAPKSEAVDENEEDHTVTTCSRRESNEALEAHVNDSSAVVESILWGLIIPSYENNYEG
jgi:hypothetical protein